jgi:hypothetical protein
VPPSPSKSNYAQNNHGWPMAGYPFLREKEICTGRRNQIVPLSDSRGELPPVETREMEISMCCFELRTTTSGGQFLRRLEKPPRISLMSQLQSRAT